MQTEYMCDHENGFDQPPVSQLLYLLNVDLNVFLKAVAIQVQDQVVDKIKAVTHDDQRQLVSKLSLLSGKEITALFGMKTTQLFKINMMALKTFQVKVLYYVFFFLPSGNSSPALGRSSYFPYRFSPPL